MNRAQLRRALLLLALGGLGALIVGTRVPFCPMAGVLGIPCPGCGLSRATLALLRGNIREALHFHPLVFVIAPVFLWAIGSTAFDFVRGPRPKRSHQSLLSQRATTVLATTLLLATLFVWGLRFAGYLGGPVPVVTLSAWLHSH